MAFGYCTIVFVCLFVCHQWQLVSVGANDLISSKTTLKNYSFRSFPVWYFLCWTNSRGKPFVRESTDTGIYLQVSRHAGTDADSYNRQGQEKTQEKMKWGIQIKAHFWLNISKQALWFLSLMWHSLLVIQSLWLRSSNWCKTNNCLTSYL